MFSGDETMSIQECINCHTKYGIDEIVYFCKKCGDILEIKLDMDRATAAVKTGDFKKTPLSVWRYREFMPIHESTKLVTLKRGWNRLTPFRTFRRSIRIN